MRVASLFASYKLSFPRSIVDGEPYISIYIIENKSTASHENPNKGSHHKGSRDDP